MLNINVDELKKFDVIGIRGLAADESYKVGDYLRNSYDWNYEEDHSSFEDEEPVELDGTCAFATGIDAFYDDDEEIIEKLEAAIEKHSELYCYKSYAIIAGESYEHGCDANEIIIEDAQLVTFI